MSPGEIKEFLYIESLGMIEVGNSSEDFYKNINKALLEYEEGEYNFKEYLQQKFPDKRIVRRGLDWHILD